MAKTTKNKKKTFKQKDLTSKQRRHLKGLGHHLANLAMVGREGITDSMVNSVEDVLVAHELVKVRVQNNSPVDRKEVADLLAKATGAAVVQVLGKTVLLFRENIELHPDKKIKLP